MSAQQGNVSAHDVNDDVDQPTDVAPLLSTAEEGSSAYYDKPELGMGKLLALTCINGGLQVFFSTVMANLPPYLHTLGLSKSATAPIIICLPLSGAFIGPMAGAFSDQLQTRWGRRRPVILGGAFLTATFLLLLSWTEQLVKLLGGCQPHDSCSGGMQKAVVIFAVTCTVFLSVSVQPVQAGVRSLIVDVAPSSQQNRASSWAGRIQGASAIFSFFASSINLPSMPGLGRLTQFQALALLNLITLGSTVLTTCLLIRETDSRQLELPGDDKKSALAVLKHILLTVQNLHGRIRQTCATQFCSWFAWFPLLYYTTTYIGELGAANMMGDKNGEQDHGAQTGSLGSLAFAIVGFVAITSLPLLLPLASKVFKSRAEQNHDADSAFELRDLVWLWVGTQPILGLLLVTTLAAVYEWQGIVLIAAAGIPWAVTQWVPFAIVGYETSRFDLTGPQRRNERIDSQSGAILGVHNMAISLPQVLSGLISSLTYKVAEVAGSDVPTSWVLATSGIAAFIASLLAKRTL